MTTKSLDDTFINGAVGVTRIRDRVNEIPGARNITARLMCNDGTNWTVLVDLEIPLIQLGPIKFWYKRIAFYLTGHRLCRDDGMGPVALTEETPELANVEPQYIIWSVLNTEYVWIGPSFQEMLNLLCPAE